MSRVRIQTLKTFLSKVNYYNETNADEFQGRTKAFELRRQRKKRCTDRASMHLLFEASLTQPNSANLLGKKSEQQRGTGPSYM